MVMKNPVHPGEILREDVLGDLGMSVGEAASRLGISRVTLSRVLHGHARVSRTWPSAWKRPASELPVPGWQCSRRMTWPWSAPAVCPRCGASIRSPDSTDRYCTQDARHRNQLGSAAGLCL